MPYSLPQLWTAKEANYTWNQYYIFIITCVPLISEHFLIYTNEPLQQLLLAVLVPLLLVLLPRELFKRGVITTFSIPVTALAIALTYRLVYQSWSFAGFTFVFVEYITLLTVWHLLLQKGKETLGLKLTAGYLASHGVLLAIKLVLNLLSHDSLYILGYDWVVLSTILYFTTATLLARVKELN